MKYKPSNNKYNKYFKIRKYKTISKPQLLNFGQIGVKALESAFFSHFFIEKLHLYLRRKFKKKGKVWFKVLPFIGVTKKPLEVRMGKGKGPNEYWVYPLKRGQIFMELTINNLNLRKKVLKALHMKLPLKIKIINNKI